MKDKGTENFLPFQDGLFIQVPVKEGEDFLGCATKSELISFDILGDFC